MLGTYLNATYGIPTRIASIMTFDNQTATTQHVEWIWNATDQPGSTIGSDQALLNSYIAPLIQRFAWRSGQDLWLMDFVESRTFTETRTHLTPGKMRPPTLYAESGMEDYLGQGAALLGLELSGGLEKFGDADCKSPL